MTSLGIFQILIYFLVILALTKPVGAFMARVFQGERTFLHPVLRWLETLVYKLTGVREDEEQHWTRYAGALIAFSLFSFLFTYVIQRVQGLLPFNPQHFGAGNVSPDLSFNTAVSFLTNTNWQAYSGESTLSYLVQMAALTVQNFASAGAGIAIAIALVRGFARQQSRTIGNFWVDMTRAIVYILLPLSLIGALFLSSQGVIQNFSSYTKATTVEGATQTIAQGPVASQEAIKMIGTNGGGFFNANSAHPFENPTPLTNFVQMLMIFIIPAGLTYTFGKMVGKTRQGWAIFAAMSIMFLAGVFVAYWAEQSGNPILTKLGLENHATATQPGGNMEGKETRFGIAATALFATITTDASCGAVDRHARQLHAARRTGAAVQHHDRRSDFRRRRRGTLRHAAVRHPSRLHRRPDGGPHAGISRQEDRTKGSEDGDARRDRHRRGDSGVQQPQQRGPFPEKGYWNAPGRRRGQHQ